MSTLNHWFEIIKHKEHLIVIREKLSEIDPRFHTIYTNMYLLLGSHTALLIDTGCGLFPLKPLIDELIGKRKLLVFNTHCHWDHVCGNYEFNEIYIHEKEAAFISKPINISNLKDSSKDIVKKYEKNNFLIPPAPVIKNLKEGDKIDLGDYNIEVIHTPGHSPGAISLFTDKNELFSDDTAHYGAVFLPKKNKLHEFLSSISKLMTLCEKKESIEIYPSHEEFPLGKELLEELYNKINNIENSWNTKQKNKDNFLRSWIIDDGKYKFVISKI